MQPAPGDSNSKQFVCNNKTPQPFNTRRDFNTIPNHTSQTHKRTRTCLIHAAPVMFAKIYQAIRPCKKKTKRHGRKRAALASVSLCLSAPWEVIDPYRPFAHMPGRSCSNSKDFCSSLTAWPLLFPSRTGRRPGAVNLAEWDQMKHDDKPGWNLSRLKLHCTFNVLELP